MERIDEKYCLITGSSKGLGKSLLNSLIETGYNVISINRTNPDNLPNFYPCDLSNIGDLDRVVRQIHNDYPKIDLLINNAGTFHESQFENIDLNDWNYTIQVNLTTPFYLTQKLLPLIKKSNCPKIVNISSTAGLEGKENQSVYCASKHGLMGLFRALKIELRHYNISVHNICTGGLDTDFTLGTQIYDKLKSQTLLDVKNISEVITYLISLPQDLEISELVINRFKKN